MKKRNLDRSIVLSPERLLPPDHFYRNLDNTFDFAFIYEWTVDLYAPIGRSSIDPVLFFKLQLLMFLEGIRPERRLIDVGSLYLAHRSYLRYNLDEMDKDDRQQVWSGTAPPLLHAPSGAAGYR